MLLTYALHRVQSFFNLMSDLECAKHMLILKFNSTLRIFFNLDLTFSISRSAVTRLTTRLQLMKVEKVESESKFFFEFRSQLNFLHMLIMSSKLFQSQLSFLHMLIMSSRIDII